MKKMSNQIVFFGSGPVAAKALELLAQNFSIEAVVTKPKPPHHKGSFPVLDLATRLNLPVMTASNKRELSSMIAQQQFKSKLAVLIDFGIIVTQDVIDAFPLGIINSHFSLLPEWRGADPITFSILSGQKTTGVSLMLIDEGMDTGDLLAQAPYDISPDQTTPELTDALIELSDLSLKKIIPLWLAGETQATPQSEATMAASKEPTYSRKLTKGDGVIDWTKPADVIEREVRAFIEWPKSQTELTGLPVVITEAKVVNASGAPGSVKAENKQLIVHCGKDALQILRLKPAGKKEMTAEAFLAGYGSRLGV